MRLVPVSSLARTIRKAVPDVKSTQDFGETGSGAFLLGVMSARTFDDAFGYVKYARKAVPFGNLVLHDTKVEEHKRQTAACSTRSLMDLLLRWPRDLRGCNYLHRQTMTESASLQDCSVTSLQDLLSKIHCLEVDFDK